MRILSFGHLPSWAGGRQESGLANVIYQLAKHMSDCDGAEVSLAATDVFVPSIKHDGLTIYGWTKGMLLKYAIYHPIISLGWLCAVINAKRKFGPTVSIMGYFFKGLHLSRCINTYKPDVVHLHGMTACVYDKVVPSNTKIIVTMHGIIGRDTTIPYQEWRSKMEREVCLSHRYSLIGFIAEKLIGQFRDLYGTINSPTRAILNAYDGKAFNYIESKQHDGLVLATVASFSENKGQKRVIEAISRAGINAKYICIGGATDAEAGEYSQLAKSLNVDFDYVGKKNPTEIREILSGADFMILPSSTEGFGLVYLEAIACGVPVILPKHLPIVQEKSIIQPGVNAILLKDSSAEAIAEVLPKLKDYHFDHRKVADSIIGYSWEGIAKQYVDSIKEII